VILKPRDFVLSLTVALGILFVLAPPLNAQAPKTRREALGSQRATQMETLLQSLYPGATVEWEPELAVRLGSQAPIPIDVGDFKVNSQPDGSLTIATVVEAGTAKRDYIEKVKKFQVTSPQAFTSTIVVLRTDASGKTVDLKKAVLDPNDPVTKINWFEVQKWSPTGWPVLRLAYESYTLGSDSLITIDWDSLFDAATGSFLARIPSGIEVMKKNGEQTGELLSAHRSSPTQIELTGNFTKKVIIYTCGDPCVVDGPTLLAQWAKP